MGFLEKYKAHYVSFFSINEFYASSRTVLLAWALLFFQLYLFQELMSTAAGTVKAFADNTYTCWPYAPRCGEWYFFLRPPLGYSLSFTYMLATLLVLFSAYSLYMKRFVRAHIAMLVLSICEAFFLFFVSYNIGETYMYLHLLLCVLLLVIPNKIWFIRRFIVFCYIAAGVTTGALLIAAHGYVPPLPLIPDSLEMLFVYCVIAIECVGALYLLSSEEKTKKVVLVFLLVAHLYAGIAFEYQYFLLIAPLLLIVFSGSVASYSEDVKYSRTSAIFLVGTVVCATLLHVYLIEKTVTYQFTFVRPHGGVALWFPPTSGISTMDITYKDGKRVQKKDEWSNRPCKCSPYTRLFEIKNMCARDTEIQNINWRLTVRGIDGAWRDIVTTEHACDLTFSFLKHNQWIQPRLIIKDSQ